MIVDALLAKIFGTKNEREIKGMLPLVAAINDLEPAMLKLSDIDLAAKTIEFKEKLAQGATLDDLLVEAFAVVRDHYEFSIYRGGGAAGGAGGARAVAA